MTDDYAKGFADAIEKAANLLKERAQKEYRIADSFKDSREGHYRAVARQLEQAAKDVRKLKPEDAQ